MGEAMSNLLCESCGLVFPEADADTATEVQTSEFWGMRETRRCVVLVCPHCRSCELSEPCEVDVADDPRSDDDAL
jgi:hypothetical protein